MNSDINFIIKNLEKQGLIEKQNIGFDQVTKHLNRANKDLAAAEANLTIDTEVAYSYSYLAMLRSGRALMFSSGWRPVDGQQHKTVVVFCQAVLGENFTILIANFDRMRKFRNKFTYDEPDILVSQQETKQALKKAKIFVSEITQLIQKNNPQEKLF